MVSIIRTESHLLATSPDLRLDVERTVAFYRRMVKLFSTVAITHWDTLGSMRSKERQMALEAMIHPTADRPNVRYPCVSKALGKMPSYLRRAAIHSALGAVSSFLSNYSNWLGGEIGGKKRNIGSKTPSLGYAGVYPSLYGGNMILYGVKKSDTKVGKLDTPVGFVRIKLLKSNGQWEFSEPIKVKGKNKRLKTGAMDFSPSLIQRGAKVSLSCPVEVQTPKYIKNEVLRKQHTPFRVCSVDVGINTAASLAIVDSTGTVIARKFLNCGRHNDQRDKLGAAIADKQRASGGTQRHQSFCSGLHRRIAGISLDAARQLSSEIASFAQAHGASLLVIEDLKGWKPKGPNHKQRKRFHRFQHRMLIKHLSLKAQELGVRMIEIYARGTSRWAYDGSGKVTRSAKNAQLATFASGKRYNADLNGALNIAARGIATVLGIKNKSATGKSSGAEMRMPLVLADIWTFALASRMSNGHDNRLSKGVGVCL